MSSLCARSLDIDQFTLATTTLPAMTHNPSGHILGVIGLGRIGSLVAKKAFAALNMRIMYYDISRKSADLEEAIQATYVTSMDDVLTRADCVVLATPYMGQILLHREHFFRMKPGARFVNIARGKLVDEDGLYSAIESGHLFAAGMDVHFDEPKVHSGLGSHPHVEVQCHIGGGSIESHMGFEKLGIENILQFFKTGKAISPVNLHMM